MLHQNDIDLWKKTEALAWRLAAEFDLPLKVVEPKRRPIAGNAAGLCYCNEGRISIVLREKNRVCDGGAWWSKPCSWKQISETVAHELAHLLHQNHGAQFKELEAKIIKSI